MRAVAWVVADGEIDKEPLTYRNQSAAERVVNLPAQVVVPLVDGRDADELLLRLRNMLQWAVRYSETALISVEAHYALHRDLTAARAAIAKAMP